MPFSALVETLPRDVTHVGVDEARREYVAYKRDGTLFGRYAIGSSVASAERRGASQCGDLSVDDAKTRMYHLGRLCII